MIEYRVQDSSLLAPRTGPVSACPVCDDRASIDNFEAEDLLLGVPGRFRYVKCTICRSVYQNFRVIGEDVPLCYPAQYFTHQSSRDVTHHWELGSASTRAEAQVMINTGFLRAKRGAHKGTVVAAASLALAGLRCDVGMLIPWRNGARRLQSRRQFGHCCEALLAISRRNLWRQWRAGGQS